MREKWAITCDKWEVSTLGRVRSLRTGKLIKIRLRRDGYLDVKLSYRRFLVHRLVALAFIPNPGSLPQVNHLNGNRANATLSNLEWVDQFANMRHAIAIGLFPDRRGPRNGRATISQAKALEIKNTLRLGVSIGYAAKLCKVPYSIVANIKRGQAWAWLTIKAVR